ncbi:Urease accessory protein UreH [Rhynchospora pubera]|uniref:Urease accessory protein UreH n=1 Tax=Rhynchospora pubera TaxID=906938 RepID=A0AAV8E7S7_9POAL|nr:Urease accessory protein UreH [Rhynchospora pubera]
MKYHVKVVMYGPKEQETIGLISDGPLCGNEKTIQNPLTRYLKYLTPPAQLAVLPFVSHLTRTKTPLYTNLFSLSMERLISSPHPTPAFSRPRLLASRASFAPKLPPHCVSRRASKSLLSLFSKQDGPPPVSLTDGFQPISPELKDGETESRVESPGRRFLASSGFKKVASASLLALLSSILLKVCQPAPAFATLQASAAKTTTANLVKTEVLNSAWTGFLAGCLHTLSGPDHLAALAPLSIGRSRLESAVVGALWGCGHDAGQVIFGLLFLLLKDRLHIEIIRTWGTRVVGLTLLTIGAFGIREASEVPVPAAAGVEGSVGIPNTDTLEPVPMKKKKIGFATFATGIVHGLQPDALIMVLPALALPSRLAGAAFLGMFLVGTVIAMGSYTVFIGSFTQALKDRIPRITEKLTWAASLVAISMGLGIIISQFFGFSLY